MFFNLRFLHLLGGLKNEQRFESEPNLPSLLKPIMLTLSKHGPQADRCARVRPLRTRQTGAHAKFPMCSSMAQRCMRGLHVHWRNSSLL